MFALVLFVIAFVSIAAYYFIGCKVLKTIPGWYESVLIGILAIFGAICAALVTTLDPSTASRAGELNARFYCIAALLLGTGMGYWVGTVLGDLAPAKRK